MSKVHGVLWVRYTGCKIKMDYMRAPFWLAPPSVLADGQIKTSLRWFLSFKVVLVTLIFVQVLLI